MKTNEKVVIKQIAINIYFCWDDFLSFIFMNGHPSFEGLPIGWYINTFLKIIMIKQTGRPVLWKIFLQFTQLMIFFSLCSKGILVLHDYKKVILKKKSCKNWKKDRRKILEKRDRHACLYEECKYQCLYL